MLNITAIFRRTKETRPPRLDVAAQVARELGLPVIAIRPAPLYVETWDRPCRCRRHVS